MKIHEHQAVDFFERYGIPVPKRVLCFSEEEVGANFDKIGSPSVVKAQVLVGGRGKAGGVKLVKTKEEATKVAGQILGMNIKECTVEKVLLAEAVSIGKEFYVGFINDRNSKSVTLMVSAEGGVEIEEVAKTNPDAIIKFSIDPLIGLLDFQARNIAMKLFNNANLARQAATIFQKLYKLYLDTDASLAEINPMVQLTNGSIMAIDGKMNFDDNALYRQVELEKMRELDEDEQTEVEAKEHGLSYVRLDGNIGCMVNGAGLAMATMDSIKLYGGSPANFLDIGGSSNPEKVIKAMDILLNDKNVQAVMINIFGGITRCDDVAKGLILALEKIKTNIPIVVRLSGTNAQEGLALLKETGLPTVKSMAEAAKLAISKVG